MKKFYSAFLFLLTLFVTAASSQSNIKEHDELLENMSDSARFRVYLDSMREALSSNHIVFDRNIKKCERLLFEGVKIPLKDKFEYALQSMYSEFYANDLVSAYKISNNFKHLLNDSSIPSRTKNAFIYMQGYIAMELDDSKTAQKIFYSQVENGEKRNDTTSIVQSLYSLGQLYRKEKDFDSAEEYFLKSIKLNDSYFNTPLLVSTQASLELATIYIKQKDFTKLEQCLDSVIVKIDADKILDSKVHYHLLRSELEAEKGNFTKAENFHLAANELAHKLNNEFLINSSENHYIYLLEKKGKYAKVLELTEKKINKISADNYLDAFKWYKYAHESASKLGAFEKAYKYSEHEKTIQDSIITLKKTQQTEFIKVKFESEQKEKENHILAAKVAQEQSQNQFLYSLSALFLITSIGLFGAFFQKRKYNRRLRKEVKNRTEDLEKTNHLLITSNQELNQFNQILSHDLKEPLRSIVGFSNLAQKEVAVGPNLTEYLDIIAGSGRQLHQLIEDVLIFQSIGTDVKDQATQVNTETLIRTFIDNNSNLIAEKNAEIRFDQLPIIRTNRRFMYIIFKNLIFNGLIYNKSAVPLVTISYSAKGQFHCFRFKDNGIGISVKYQESIFKMFKRLNNRRVHKGSGLGLSISKKILSRINGNIQIVESEENQGSIFEVSFPILDGDSKSGHQLEMTTSDQIR